MQEILPRLSLDTVYRNLRLLAGIGVLHQISLSSGAVFELIGDISDHHHHLICVDCEKVVCFSYCPDFREYGETARKEGFSLLGHSFELFGRCADCNNN
jgi:Fe2+ or Zn2+ uptake regulation protein